MDRFDAVVIGAGVAGAAIAFELASYGVETLVLERAPGPAAGSSGANAGILHTAYAMPESFETSMILAGNARWPATFDELKIPYRACGAVLIALDSSQVPRLGEVEKIATDRGIKVRFFDRGQIRNFEPQAKASAGLLVPGEAVTDPYVMVSRLLAAGPTVRYSSSVKAVDAAADGALVRCDAGDVEARYVVNCSGLFADQTAGDDSFTLTIERGEFVVFPPEAAVLTDHIISPLPNGAGPETVIFPTIYGNLCAMAIVGQQSDKHDWKIRAESVHEVQTRAARLMPKLNAFKPVDSWAGLRAVAHPRDFIAEWSKRVPRMFNVAALGAGGLSAALGLAAYVLDRCRERGLMVKARQPRSARAQEQIFPWWQHRKR